MSALAKIPVTEAMKCDYELMRSLVALTSLDWIVIRVNPNCDARAMACIRSEGLIAYQPMEPLSRWRKGQRKTLVDASRPFFPRYVFVGLDRTAGQGAEMVRTCDGVEKILSFHLDHRPHIVRARHMQRIMEAAWKAQTDREYIVPQYFELGEQVRITTNAFVGFPAIVTAYDEQKARLEVDVQIFGRTTPVELDVDNVEKI